MCRVNSLMPHLFVFDYVLASQAAENSALVRQIYLADDGGRGPPFFQAFTKQNSSLSSPAARANYPTQAKSRLEWGPVRFNAGV
jgi:hypothetical protein